MKKFAMILGLCLVVAVTVSFLGATNVLAKEITITYESVYPKGHMRFKFIEDAMDQIEAKAKGKLIINRHYGEPVTKKAALNALTRGTIDMLVAYPVYYDGKIAVGDWQQMPGNFKKWEDCYDLCVVGKVADIMDKAYREKSNAVYLGLNPVAPYNFQVAKRSKKIKTFEDFKGLKIRASGGSASIAIKALGASPVQTIGGEYYQAMQRGIVDAGLMTTYSLKQYRLWEVADQIVNPPLIGYAVAFVWMNQNTWNKLGPDLQKLFLDTIRSKNLWKKWIAVYDNEQDGPIVEEAKSKGVEFYTLPKAESDKMFKATAPVWDWYIEQCEKQGMGAEAKEVRQIIQERFLQ